MSNTINKLILFSSLIIRVTKNIYSIRHILVGREQQKNTQHSYVFLISSIITNQTNQ